MRHLSAVVIAVSVPLALAAQMPVQTFPTAVGVEKITPIYLSFRVAGRLRPPDCGEDALEMLRNRLPFGSRFFWRVSAHKGITSFHKTREPDEIGR